MGVTLVPSPFSWGRNPFQCEAGEAWTWLSHQDPARAGAGPGRDPRQPLQGPRSGGGRCRAGLAQAPPEGPARGAAGGWRGRAPEVPPPQPDSAAPGPATGGGRRGGPPPLPAPGRRALPLPGAADLPALSPQAARPHRVLPAAAALLRLRETRPPCRWLPAAHGSGRAGLRSAQ